MIKSTVVSYLNLQESFDILRKIKKLHFEVKPAFLETILDKIRSYSVEVEILTPLASLYDELVNDLLQKNRGTYNSCKKIRIQKKKLNKSPIKLQRAFSLGNSVVLT